MSSFILRLAAWCARILPTPARQVVYRLGPISRGLRQLLSRAAPVGLTEVTVAAGALAGTRLVLDLQTEKDLWLGTYEAELQTAVSSFARPGMVAYDVGANIGYVSLMLARRVGGDGSLIAFEPLPANLERLRRNLALQPDGWRVRVVPMAVAERTGRKRFFVHASAGMGKLDGSAGRDESYTEAVEVESISLDHFVFELRNQPPNLVKMDIEGGEVLALAGMQRVLSEIHPILLLELHGPQAAAATWQALTHAGYSIHSMRAGYPPVLHLASLPWKAYILGLTPAASEQEPS